MSKIKLMFSLIKPGYLLLMIALWTSIMFLPSLLDLADWQANLIKKCSVIILALLVLLLIVKVIIGFKKYGKIKHTTQQSEPVEGRISGYILAPKNQMILTYNWWDSQNRILHEGHTKPHPKDKVQHFGLGQTIHLHVTRGDTVTAEWERDLAAFVKSSSKKSKSHLDDIDTPIHSA